MGHECWVAYGTMFSGMEVFSYAMSCLLKVWARITGVVPELSLEWVVEKDTWKTDFIIEKFKPKQCFQDVLEVAESKWRGHDRISGELTSLNRNVRGCAGGFDCDTVSTANTKRKDMNAADCIKNQTGKTGTTAGATFKLLEVLRTARL